MKRVFRLLMVRMFGIPLCPRCRLDYFSMSSCPGFCGLNDAERIKQYVEMK